MPVASVAESKAELKAEPSPQTNPETAVPSTAAAYAQRLLAALGATPLSAVEVLDQHPAIAWASSGLMSLTGHAGGPGLMCPVPLASCADGALAALASLAPIGAFDRLRGAALLGERAAILGLRRGGEVSPGGACRLYAVAEGCIALNLPRAEDRELLPAWLELPQVPEQQLAALLAKRPVDDLIERGRLLGLALAPSRPPATMASEWFEVSSRGIVSPAQSQRAPRVVDLSSLWAGPLCGHLLQRLGAEVIKLESPQRPDGARQGHAGFFNLHNAGKRCVAIDPRTQAGRRQWLALLRSADIIIEGSRPRGLRQLGIDAEVLLRERPGLTWLAISGHGRGEPRENWLAYGDDAAVDAGLSHLMQTACGEHVIVGDAIADPMTGVHAALAAWASWRQGGGALISVSLSGVMRHCIGYDLPGSIEALRQRQHDWTAMTGSTGPLEPVARAAAGAARAMGADTDAVLDGLC